MSKDQNPVYSNEEDDDDDLDTNVEVIELTEQDQNEEGQI